MFYCILTFISIFICLGLWANLYANVKTGSIAEAITWKIFVQLN